MSSPPEQAASAVRDLLAVLDWLASSLMPGTAKPYRAPQMSAEKRAASDALARLERLERVDTASGETPPPFDLDVADLLSEVMATADELADRVSVAAKVAKLAPASSAFADPTPYLRHVLQHLPAAVAADSGLVDAVEGRCDSLVFRAHGLLGLLGDGQLLTAACPWCGGRTASNPVGGARTLRVRAQLPHGQSLSQVDPKDVRWFVVCEGGLCVPPDADCGNRLRGRPAWPLQTEGEWLAMRLERAAS